MSKETELETIARSPKFDVPHFGEMRVRLDAMERAINALLANSDGWKGDTAAAGKKKLAALAKSYRELSELTTTVETVVGDANRAIDTAVGRLDSLPGAAVPTEVLNAVGTSVNFMGVEYPIAGAVGAIAKLLANKREEAASSALSELNTELQIQAARLPIPDRGKWEEDSQDHTGDTGGSSGPDGGGSPSISAGTGNTGGYNTGGGYLVGAPVPPTPTGPRPSVDGTPTPKPDPFTPTPLPRPNPVTPFPGGGGGGGGGGLVPGLGGAGAAAGLATAAKVGGIGAGGATSAAGAAGGRLGSGLSGGTVGGASSSSGAAGAGGAGGRGASNTMMGGGGAGGASQEKQKRSGLGGLIAPKLEDDEELGPRSAAADAGGRD